MQNTFSDNLVAQARAYFSQKYGRDISVDEAIEILSALAGVYESFVDFITDA